MQANPAQQQDKADNITRVKFLTAQLRDILSVSLNISFMMKNAYEKVTAIILSLSEYSENSSSNYPS